jgi:hypothetical protein
MRPPPSRRSRRPASTRAWPFATSGDGKGELAGPPAALTDGELKDCAPAGAELWIDGGHNPGAGAAIAEALAEMEERDPRPLYVIAGMIATKDQAGYFRNFAGMASASSPSRWNRAKRACPMTNWPRAPWRRA